MGWAEQVVRSGLRAEHGDIHPILSIVFCSGGRLQGSKRVEGGLNYRGSEVNAKNLMQWHEKYMEEEGK